MGDVVNESQWRWQRQDQKNTEQIDALLRAIGLSPDGPSPTYELASIRYSWGTSLEDIHDDIRRLLKFCQRYGLCLYDGQARRYIAQENIGVAIRSLARGRIWAEGLLGPIG